MGIDKTFTHKALAYERSVGFQSGFVLEFVTCGIIVGAMLLIRWLF